MPIYNLNFFIKVVLSSTIYLHYTYIVTRNIFINVSHVADINKVADNSRLYYILTHCNKVTNL